MSFPDSLSMVTLTGEFLDGDGEPRSGIVIVTLPLAIRSEGDNVVIPPFELEQDLVSGLLAIELPALTDPDWLPNEDARYIVQVIFTEDFKKLWWEVPVPWDGGDALDLADCGAPNVGTPSNTILQGITNGAADGGYRGPFSSTRLYRSGDTVEYAGKAYGALKTSVNATPNLTPLVWRQYPASGGGGGGAVDSVNGQTGDVTLTKTDIGLANVDNTSDANKPVSTATQLALNAKVATTRLVATGTGLLGGGDLSANRTLTPDFGTGAGKVVEGNDSRLGDARVPTAHASTHADGGVDEVALDGSQITTGTVPFVRLPTGTGATQVAIGNHTHGGGGGGAVDSWNTRTGAVVPVANDYAIADITGLSAALALKAPLASPALTGAPTINAVAIVLDDDSRLTDDRDPTAHAASHAAGGSDEVTLTQAQITGLTGSLAALQPLDSDLTAIAALTPVDDNILQRKAGVWVDRTPAQLKTDLVLTKSDVGLSNVDNTTDLAKPISTATQTALNALQPLDSDLTTLAGLTATTNNVIQSVGSAWASRTPAQLKATLALAVADVTGAVADTRTISTTAPLSGGGDLSTNRTLTLLDDGVTNAKLANMAASTIKGNNTAGSTDPADLTVAQVKTLLAYTASDVGAQPVDTDLTTIAALTATTDNIIQSVAGAWASRTPTQVKAALAIAQGDVTGLTAALAALQPLDSDLTAIAALTATTDNIIQSVAGAWASRTPAQVKAALAIAQADVSGLTAALAALQPLDADLTTISGLTATTDSVMQAKAGAWSARTMVQLLADLAAVGTTFQPLDADLTTIAALTATTDSVMQAKAGAWTARTIAQLLADLAVPGTTFQPLDSDLTTIAGLTATTDNMIQSVGSAWASRTPAQVKTALAIAQSDVSGLTAALALLAPLASPALTGTATIVNGTFSGRQLNTPVALTPGTTVSVNAALGNDFTLTAAQNFTLANPTNAVNGQKILFAIRQDGTGTRVMTLDTNYRLGADITAVVLSTAINKTDYLGVRYNGTDSKWDVIAFVKGY